MNNQISDVDRVWSLSRRQIEIAWLICKDLDNPEIAKVTNTLPKTVSSHLTSIYNTLDVEAESHLEKREKLITRYGAIINSIIKSRGDLRTYNRRKKIYWDEKEKKSDISNQTPEIFESPPPHPEMFENPPPPRTRINIRRPALTMLLIVSFFIIMFSVYWFFSPTQVIQPPVVPSSSNTPVSTKTAYPSSTVINTTTSTQTSPRVIFFDDFSNGIKPDWKIDGEEPYTVNGMVTNNSETWMYYQLPNNENEEELDNYAVEWRVYDTNYIYKYKNYVYNKPKPVSNYVGIFSTSINDLNDTYRYVFMYSPYDWTWWQVFNNTFIKLSASVPSGDLSNYYDSSNEDYYKYEIEAHRGYKNNAKTYINGKLFKEINLPSTNSLYLRPGHQSWNYENNIVIYLDNTDVGVEDNKTKIDYIKISKLPSQ